MQCNLASDSLWQAHVKDRMSIRPCGALAVQGLSVFGTAGHAGEAARETVKAWDWQCHASLLRQMLGKKLMMLLRGSLQLQAGQLARHQQQCRAALPCRACQEWLRLDCMSIGLWGVQ